MIILREKLYFDYSEMEPSEARALRKARNQIAAGVHADRKSVFKAAREEASNLKRAVNVMGSKESRPVTAKEILGEVGGRLSLSTSGLENGKGKSARDRIEERIKESKLRALDGVVEPYKYNRFTPKSASEIARELLNRQNNK